MQIVTVKRLIYLSLNCELIENAAEWEGVCKRLTSQIEVTAPQPRWWSCLHGWKTNVLQYKVGYHPSRSINWPPVVRRALDSWMPCWQKSVSPSLWMSSSLNLTNTMELSKRTVTQSQSVVPKGGAPTNISKYTIASFGISFYSANEHWQKKAPLVYSVSSSPLFKFPMKMWWVKWYWIALGEYKHSST